MTQFLENFYEVLTAPKKAFDRLKENPPVFQGLFIVVFVSILNNLLNFDMSNGSVSLLWLIFSIVGAAIGGIVSWLFFAIFLEIIAYIFDRSGKFNQFLTLSGFALLPWIFLGPIELLKSAGIVGKIIGVILGLTIWVWVVSLTVLAIIKSYDLSLQKTLSLIAVLFLSSILLLFWYVGFFTTLFGILS